VLTSTHEHHFRRILDAFEADRAVTQRSLARELGIALGLTNLLVKRLVRKGWIRVIHVKSNRVRYLLTATGLVEKSRMSRAYLESSLQFYKQARDRIQHRFSLLTAAWPASTDGERTKRIVFYGAGEVAEIGYICLADADFELVGVVDRERTKPFFGLHVCRPEQVAKSMIAGRPFDCLIVMSFRHTDALKAEVSALKLPAATVYWL
jgi:DNA-binding MarR family transcriptional regulator